MKTTFKMQQLYLKGRTNGGSLNLIPLLIIAILVYAFFTYDLESLMKNKQLNDNIAFIKNKAIGVVDKYSNEVQNNFLKSDNVNGTNKTDIFNLNNFLPQNNKLNSQEGAQNINNQENKSFDPKYIKSYGQRPAGYEDNGALH